MKYDNALSMLNEIGLGHWTEAGPNGIMTNPDPTHGGIIDKTFADEKWFVILNSQTKAIHGFDTREEAAVVAAKLIKAGAEAENNKRFYTYKAEIPVDVEAIQIAFARTISGNSNQTDWVVSAELVKGYVNPNLSAAWWTDQTLFERSFHIKINYLERPGNSVATKLVNNQTVTDALTMMAVRSVGHFSDFVNETHDDLTYDIFMQYVILGSVKYTNRAR
jgi:hypothetical protein